MQLFRRLWMVERDVPPEGCPQYVRGSRSRRKNLVRSFKVDLPNAVDLPRSHGNGAASSATPSSAETLNDGTATASNDGRRSSIRTVGGSRTREQQGEQNARKTTSHGCSSAIFSTTEKNLAEQHSRKEKKKGASSSVPTRGATSSTSSA
ncbi:unnamed protein product [Amoebophrya sp. A25]|nr:unnamed protein product [Amoebophrya sp. A25]|eukprot:GSA25T00015061001.1